MRMQLCHVWGVCLVAAIFINHVTAEDVSSNTMVGLESIMEDLEFIEEQEDSRRANSDGKADPDLVDAMLINCEAELMKNTEVDPGSNFNTAVRVSLIDWNKCLSVWNSYSASAAWDFETNITNETETVYNEVQVKVSGYSNKLTQLAKSYLHDERYSTLSEDYQRQVRLLAGGATPKDEQVQRKIASLQSEIENIYSKATVDGLAMEPDLTNKMASKRDGYTLQKYWVGWRDATGKLMKDKYASFIENLNIGAKENGYDDYGQSWLESQFDNVDDIKSVSERLWSEVEPLYQQLHAYVRTELAGKYPEYEPIYRTGGIPAHLTGNMWAQQWTNIYDMVKPFDGVQEPDYDDAMDDQGYTVDDMFTLAEDFYTSIDLPKMTDKFNRLTMKVRPEGREVVCHASATDFYKEDDFRIKMCTEVNTEYLEVIHHEMGHIEYFMAYKDQPTVYRDGANSGFHEAIGDTIGLSVATRKHMTKIGLDAEDTSSTTTTSSRGFTDAKKHDLNFLMKMALSKIAFLPFGYMIDKWRWDVFDGTTPKDNYNRHWWDLRLKYQGIVSPVPRSEADFDPGAKFHIPSNSPYICYFISYMLQFQFYEAMCAKSGQLADNAPLHTCDFYGSKEAGKLLRDMMSLGQSRPWNETLSSMTGSYDVKSESLLKYFQPLTDWLTEHNKNTGALIGWKDARVTWESQSGFATRNPQSSMEAKYHQLSGQSRPVDQNVREHSYSNNNNNNNDNRLSKEADIISRLLNLLKD